MIENQKWVDDVFLAVNGVLGDRATPLHEPILGEIEKSYLSDCIDSGYVSSVGAYVDRFEKELTQITGIPFAISTVNGTAALHVSLLLAGVKPDDEVLIPTLTFIATANAVSYCGAIPHLVEIEKNRLGIDPKKLRTYLEKNFTRSNGFLINKVSKRRVSAIVPVHIFGHACFIDEICEVAHEFGLAVIEDAAEALGSFDRGVHLGKKGLVSALSFNGNKVVTTGGGGAILTSDPALAKRAKHLTTTARIQHAWEYNHDAVGFNYRMPNLNAALGCAQLSQLEGFLKNKRNLAEKYKKAFLPVSGLHFHSEPENTKSNYWLNAVLLSFEKESVRDLILKTAQEKKTLMRPVWKLIHHLKVYEKCPKMDLTEAEAIERQLINLPSSAYL